MILKKDFIFYLFIFVLFLSCNKKSTPSKNYDKDFIAIPSNSNTNGKIKFIDSILKNRTNSEIEKGILFLKKGIYFSDLQNEQKAIHEFTKALSFFKKNNVKPLLAETYWRIGSSNAFLNKKVEANEILLQSLLLSKEIKDTKLEANIYNSLAHIYYLYKDYNKAIDYTLKSIALQQKYNYKDELSASYNNLAIIYKNIQNFKLALKYNLLSLEINTKMHNTSAIAKSYNNLALDYDEMSQSKKAIYYLKKAIALNEKINSTNTTSHRNLATKYFEKKQLDSAEKIAFNALHIEQKTKNPNNQIKIYNLLVSIALKNKKFEQAITFQKKRDSLSFLQSQINNQENLKLLENQYKLIVKEKELKQQKQLAKKNTILFTGIIVFILLFGLFLFQSLKNKKLKKENEIIQLEQQVLRSQMNPHFIFNALSAIQGLLLENKPIKTAGYLSKFAKLIRQNFDFIHQKSITLQEEIDALTNYLFTQQLRYNNAFEFKIKIDPDIDMYTVEIPPLLLQPFVENAIEHGVKNKNDKGKIEILVYKIDTDKICYEIKDNGKGFDQNNKDIKLHALDVFKKRLKLRNKNEEKWYTINSSDKGTTIKFCLKND